MSKVFCDICGTAYPATAKNCPICGSSREYALENMEEEILEESAPIETDAGTSRRRNREIFDYDEVNQEKPARKKLEEVEFDDEEEDYEEEPRTNVGLVIILVILIALLLLASGFFFVRYLMPNMMEKPVETESVATTLQTEPVETTDPGVPCTNLMIDGGKMELGKDGRKLLNVHVYPENTTDAVVYSSGDEAVVTVSEDGTVTAVGEGQTVITIQCGAQQIKCNVTVDYTQDEVTVPTGEIPAPQVDNQEATQATDGNEEIQAADPTEQVPDEETTEPEGETQETDSGELVLKLKKSDITISSNYTSITLEMDCDVDPADMTWFTMDSTIAICHDGVVTSTGSGMTRIYGEYEGQQVECIVRCIF